VRLSRSYLKNSLKDARQSQVLKGAARAVEKMVTVGFGIPKPDYAFKEI
jgi:hypothetical protein